MLLLPERRGRQATDIDGPVGNRGTVGLNRRASHAGGNEVVVLGENRAANEAARLADVDFVRQVAVVRKLVGGQSVAGEPLALPRGHVGIVLQIPERHQHGVGEDFGGHRHFAGTFVWQRFEHDALEQRPLAEGRDHVVSEQDGEVFFRVDHAVEKQLRHARLDLGAGEMGATRDRGHRGEMLRRAFALVLLC